MLLRIVLISTLNPVYVCNCNGISEREVQGAVELGCTTVADLSQALGVGTCCGKCVPDARKLLRRCGVAEIELRRCAGDD
jgi:bacterioferritin-associated ferredoxin